MSKHKYLIMKQIVNHLKFYKCNNDTTKYSFLIHGLYTGNYIAKY